MADKLTQAGSLFEGKRNIPSELRSAEWAMADQWLRERSFFMAGVTRGEILDVFRTEGAAILEGQSSESESLRKIEDYLDGTGYEAEAGEKGTIKDLRTARRILASLRTNVSLMRGWAQKEKGLRAGVLRAFPAWELVRFESRREERRWKERWEAVGGKLIDGRMIALKTDGIWKRLGYDFADSLRVEYPPFAWSSGMGWKQIGRAEAIKLGILDPDAPDQVSAPVRSPNESLELKPRISSPVIRAALADEMKGLAKWEGDKLVFTDPNGTRPYPAAELVKVWDEPMPAVFSKLPGGGQMQREAVRKWAEDHDEFTAPGVGETPPAGLNAQEDLRRAFGRIIPLSGDAPLYRGLSFSRRAGGEEWESFREFLASIEGTGEYYPNPFKIADSWSVAESGARKYAKMKRYSVMLVMTRHRSSRDISAIVRNFGNQVASPDPAVPIRTDGEAVFLKGTRFQVMKIEIKRDTPQGGEAVVYVEEI